MRHLKTYENYTETQQPFRVNSNGKLYVSKEIIDKIIDKYGLTPYGEMKYNDGRVIYPNMTVGIKNSPNDSNYSLSPFFYKTQQGDYAMYGRSGDSELWGSGKYKFGVRGAESSGNNLIKIFYPIWEHIPKGYKKMRNGESFLDIIDNAIENDPTLVKYGLPYELKNKWGDIEDADELGLL